MLDGCCNRLSHVHHTIGVDASYLCHTGQPKLGAASRTVLHVSENSRCCCSGHESTKKTGFPATVILREMILKRSQQMLTAA
jgi:hypothetical protein